ncbi:MAG TPA: tyrosine-type recombinase/integrase [Streptosporangiaceae bacterium]
MARTPVLGWYDGRPDRREFVAATKAEALDRRDDFMARRRDGFTPPKGRPPTVGEWLQHWLHNVARARVEATTWERSYSYSVTRLIVPYLGHVRLHELNEDDVEAWHAALSRRTTRAGRPLSAAAVTNAHRVLSVALNEAVRRQRIVRNPCTLVPPPRIDRAERPVPDSAQAAAILARCESWPNGARWVLALATGLRQGEVLALRWSDVELEGRPSVTVRRTMARVGGELVFKAPKTPKSRRTVALAPVAAERLRRHRAGQPVRGRDALVFTGPRGQLVSSQADGADWKALLADLGLPPAWRVHDLRHAAATALLQMGVDVRVVQEILGHSSAAVTQNVYQHVAPVLHERAAESLDAWLRGRG